MPWQRRFNPSEALDEAMALFWDQGFDATSIQDIVARTGVHRASLYATFGDKRALFLEALRHYEVVHRERWLNRLADAHGPIGAIAVAFDEGVQAHGRGCFLVNTALELAPNDPEVAALVVAAFEATRQFFERQLAAAGLSGSADRSGALLALFIGLRVLTRNGPAHPAVIAGVLGQAAVLTT